MSVFWKRAVERRDAFPTPPIPSNAMTGLTIRRVDLSQADNAFQKVAIFAAVNMLGSIVQMLPLNVYRYGSNQPITTPPWMDTLNGSGHGTADFLYQVMYCWGLRGNVVGLIVDRDPVAGSPRVIDLQHPDDVQVSTNAETGQPEWRIRGNVVPRSQIWHRRVYPTPGRVLGLSPIALHATTIGQGIAAQNFGAQFFLDGAHPSAILTNDNAKEIDATQARTVKERFIAAVRGTREPVVLANGWKYQAVQIAPAESQFLETQRYTASECARIYGPGMPEILGYDTGKSMTYANIEQRSLDLLTYTVDPWLVRVEQVLTELLPASQYVEFDRKALLRTDMEARYRANQFALRNAWLTINEVRDQEQLLPVPWGDEPFLPAMGPTAAAAAENDSVSVPGEGDVGGATSGGGSGASSSGGSS